MCVCVLWQQIVDTFSVFCIDKIHKRATLIFKVNQRKILYKLVKFSRMEISIKGEKKKSEKTKNSKEWYIILTQIVLILTHTLENRIIIKNFLYCFC